MGILTTQDKEKVKRAIPKANNKIIDATVARLYIAYPDPTKWAYTGLVGAIALVDDLVGHTFLKLVDIIGHRGFYGIKNYMWILNIIKIGNISILLKLKNVLWDYYLKILMMLLIL